MKRKIESVNQSQNEREPFDKKRKLNPESKSHKKKKVLVMEVSAKTMKKHASELGVNTNFIQ